MPAFLTQRGGARVGPSFWTSPNASWPLAQISVSEGAIELSVSFLIVKRHYVFIPATVSRLSAYSGLFSRGLRVEHTVAEYPPFVVFWTFGLPELTVALERAGFHVEPR